MNLSEHISKQFDAELEAVRTRVLQMGGLVEEQIVKAIDALGAGDMASIERVIDHLFDKCWCGWIGWTCGTYKPGNILYGVIGDRDAGDQLLKIDNRSP